MQRRTFLKLGLGAALASPPWAAAQNNSAQGPFDAAASALAKSAAQGQIQAASLCVRNGTTVFARSFGAAKSADDIFLLASISKPISIAAVMTLYDKGQFALDDPVKKFIPEFAGDGRQRITIRQLLTHVSGLPDQLPENHALRRRHATLAEFAQAAIRTPLLFEPGARYSYSSMGILLAAEIAQRISGKAFLPFVDEAVFRPLGMKRSALGLGKFNLEDVILNQVEEAAPESGAGDPTAKNWDWNSSFWRSLGAPWGGAHASAPDVARFLAELLHAEGKAIQPDTARMMIINHNRDGLKPRGLGFDVGAKVGGNGCSDRTFGHSGSTGTLAWADPATDTICVVLTTLPMRAKSPHPCRIASDHVAQAVAR